MKRPGRVLLLLLPCIAQAQVPPSTPPHVPPMAVSNEADAEQLALAQRQGAAYAALVEWERQGAAWSARRDAGDYRLIAALSPAEGAWTMYGGAPQWRDAPAGMVHLRVFPEDAGSLRFVPGLDVHAAFLDANGQRLGEAALPVGLYPATDAYGSNVSLPPGATRLLVEIAPLRVMRHDPYNGDRFFAPVTASFALPPLPPPSGETASDRAERDPPEALLKTRREVLEDTLKVMWKQASSGEERRAGDMIVDSAIEYAEAFWRFSPEGTFRYTLENERSAKDNAHLEIAPRDPRTGRFLPAASVSVTLSGADGYRVTDTLPLLWHSWLYHFGRNWRVPRSGHYRMDVTVRPDAIAHYGHATGSALFAPVQVTFPDLLVKTGGK